MFTTDEDSINQLVREDNILTQLGLDVVPPVVSPAVTSLTQPTIKGEDNPDAVAPQTSIEVQRDQKSTGESVPAGSPVLDPSAALKLNKMISSAFRLPGTAGRHIGVRNRTDDENASTAVLGQLLGQRIASELTDTTLPQVSHLTFAATSPQMRAAGRQKASLRDKIEEKGGTIIDKAFGVMTDALDSLTLERVRGSKTAVISKIARDMSSIVRDVTPKESDNGPGVHFHVWVPELGKESDYGEVINVRPIEKS